MKQRDNNSTRKRIADGGNRRERKLKKEMKELRQNIARVSSEIHQRKQRRKATLKEKKILKELKEKTHKEAATCNLRIVKEQWVDKLRYKKVKLEKYMEKSKRKLDNIMFQKDQRAFFRKLEEKNNRKGQMSEMDKFIEFWGGRWERRENTPHMPWIEEVKMQLNAMVTSVNDFNMSLETVRKEVAKRKGWTASGIDGIQNFGWKKFEAAQEALTKVFIDVKKDNNLIPAWLPSGRTVLLPKTDDLSDEKNFRPIMCLNILLLLFLLVLYLMLLFVKSCLD